MAAAKPWRRSSGVIAAAAIDDVPASVAAFYRELFEKELAGWPAEVREPLIDY
ncbi:MAG: hypothetical protein HOV96_05585, partial [Nonomuraea sp.]|nr:hypothetical protein [Nonomuraea sp.]NUT45051.1 hypothetical protein [Thermoactinospora sp.]